MIMMVSQASYSVNRKDEPLPEKISLFYVSFPQVRTAESLALVVERDRSLVTDASPGWEEHPKFWVWTLLSLNLGGRSPGPHASPRAEKAFEGPEMTVVHSEKGKPQHLEASSLSTSLTSWNRRVREESPATLPGSYRTSRKIQSSAGHMMF